MPAPAGVPSPPAVGGTVAATASFASGQRRKLIAKASAHGPTGAASSESPFVTRDAVRRTVPKCRGRHACRDRPARIVGRHRTAASRPFLPSGREKYKKSYLQGAPPCQEDSH